jgi:preprotein translocase subunit YajC
MMNRLICLLSLFFFQFIALGLFAQDVEEAMPPRDQMWQTVIMVAIALAFFYFILWRPEQKRRKALEQQRSSLKKGDKVTAMGIIGTIVRIQDHTVILKMFDGNKIEFLTGAITDVISGSEDDEKKADKEDRNSSKKIDISEVE